MAELVRDQVVTPQEAAALVGRIAAAAPKAYALPAHARAKILAAVSAGLEAETEELAKLIHEEVKKPLKDAQREVSRAVFTFKWASEETRRWGGEVQALDLEPGAEGRMGLTRRFPRGPVLAITPFNFPLNLVAHKLAPAMAVGAPWVLKPAPQAPRTALKLAKLILDAGWPRECMAVVSCPLEAAEALVRDDRFGTLSFTGSSKVGWHLKNIAGKKHVVLELGGNAGVFVASDADIPWAAARVSFGAYTYSGQTCISVQRILVEEAIYEPFKELLIRNMKEEQIGPLIDEKNAQRIEEWIGEAVSAGAKVLVGGKRKGDFVEPTLVEDAPASVRLSCEEAFGPVATLEKVSSRERAMDKLAEGSYGLQAGVFTNDLGLVLRNWGRLPVGGLIVNDVPTWRSDAMAYGGSKDSGIGREGVRYSMEEFTELRTLVLKQ